MGIDLPWDWARASSSLTARSPSERQGLRHRCATASCFNPANASPSPRRIVPTMSELMFGIWHAGLAAVPANAKLHGRELGYILQHSGARVCFASNELGDEDLTTHAPRMLEHLTRSAAPSTKSCLLPTRSKAGPVRAM